MVDLTLVLPVYNEEDIIETVYKEIKKVLDSMNISYECILVENGSTDNSYEIIKELEKKYRNTKAITAKKGYGSAVLKGLAEAKGKYVSYMPSDGQIDAKVLGTLWTLIKSERYDLVKVRRITRESLTRLFVSYVFSMVVKILFNTSFIDINGSPRLFKRNKLRILQLNYKDSFIDTEFAVKAHILDWKIKEIPVKTLLRIGGKSTRSWKTFLEFFVNLYNFKSGKYLSSWEQKISY